MSGCEHGMGMCGRFPFSQYPPTSLLFLSFFLSLCYFSLSSTCSLFLVFFFYPQSSLFFIFLPLIPSPFSQFFFSSYILLPFSLFSLSSRIPPSLLFILSPCVYTFPSIYRLLFSPFPFPPFLLFLPRIINFYLYLYISFGKLLMKVHRGEIPWCRA